MGLNMLSHHPRAQMRIVAKPPYEPMSLYMTKEVEWTPREEYRTQEEESEPNQIPSAQLQFANSLE